MATDVGHSLLVIGATALIEECRTAITGDPRVLADHASGRSDAAVDAEEEFNSGARVRAIGLLGLAMRPGERAAGDLLAQAIALWRANKGAAEAELSYTPAAGPDDVEPVLRNLCLQHPQMRLVGLHDIALVLAGRTPSRLRGATSNAVVVPVVERTAFVLAVTAERFAEPALPGVYEHWTAALAWREADWRSMEDSVDQYIRGRAAGRAIRYRLTRLADEHPHLGRLDGTSAGLALAVASRQALRPRAVNLLPLARHTWGRAAFSAAVDWQGQTSEVDALMAKLHGVENERLQHLIVADGQDEDRYVETAVSLNLDLDGVKTVDAAIAAGRVPFSRSPAVGVVFAGLIAIVVAIVLSAGGGRTPADPATAAGHAVAQAVSRYSTSDPDLGDLLRLELAAVAPSTANLAGAFDVWRAVDQRDLTITPPGGVASIALSPDGQDLVIGSDDGVASVWDTASGRQTNTWGPLNGVEAIHQLAFSPNGELVAFGGDDGALELQRRGGYHVPLFTASTGSSITAVNFAPDGHTLYVGRVGQVGIGESGSPNWGPVYWHNLGETGEAVTSIEEITPDRLLLCQEDSTRTFSVAMFNPYLDQVQSVTTSPGGQSLDTCPVRVTQMLYARQLGPRTIQYSSFRGDRWITTRPDALTVHTPFPFNELQSVDAAGADTGVDFDTVLAAGVRNFGLFSGYQPELLTSSAPSDSAVAMSHNTKEIAVARRGRDVVLHASHPRPPGRAVILSRDDEPGLGLALSHDGHKLIVGTRAGSLDVVPTSGPNTVGVSPTGENLAAHERTVMSNEAIRSIVLAPSGSTVWAGGQGGDVARVDLTHSGAPLLIHVLTGEVDGVALSPDGTRLAVAGRGPDELTIVSPTTLSTLATVGQGVLDGEAIAVTWLNDHDLLVSVAGSGNSSPDIYEYDTTLQRQLAGALAPGGGYATLAVDPAAPDLVAAGSLDGSVSLLSVTQQAITVRHTVTIGDGSIVTGLAWSSDGRMLLASDQNGRLSYFDTRDFSPIGTANMTHTSQSAVTLAGNGTDVAAVATNDATASVLPIGLTAWGDEICTRLNQLLSPGSWIDTVGTAPVYRRSCTPPRPPG